MVIDLPDSPAPSPFGFYSLWVILWFLIEVLVTWVLYAISRRAIGGSSSKEWENTPKWARVTLSWLLFLVVYVVLNLLGVPFLPFYKYRQSIPPLAIYVMYLILLFGVVLVTTVVLYLASKGSIGGPDSMEWSSTPKWARVTLFWLLFLVVYVVLNLLGESASLFA